MEDDSMGVGLETSFAEELKKTSSRRREALKKNGKIIQSYTKSNEPYLKTVFLLRGRAINKFIVPLVLVSLNACIWTICVMMKLPHVKNVFVEDGPWDSTLTLVVSTSLAFLLVFRLNRVAIRWWDTRLMCGTIVANCRILAEAILVHSNHEPKYRDDAISYTAGFVVAVKQHMRNEKEYDYDELAGYLNQSQVDAMAASSHPCLHATSEIRYALKNIFMVKADTPAAIGMSYSSQMRMMEKNIADLVLNMGGLERVRSTPLPIAFISHLRILNIFYLFSLPFIYGHNWGWSTIPVVILTAYALLGIDGSASECESPFSKRPNHLDLEGFCLTAMNNIEELVINNESKQANGNKQDNDAP